MNRARSQRFSRPRPAVPAVAVGPAEPRHAQAAAVLGQAHDLVAEDERQLRVRKLAVDDVQVGAAHPAGAHLEQQLTRPRLGIGQLRLAQRLSRPVEHHRPHGPIVADAVSIWGVDPAVVAARARTENFPVASLLFPRALRPHLRAVYGFARLVDILGDEVEGDRLALLDELEQRGGRLLRRRRPAWPVMQQLQPTIREFDLPREPFLRLIEANRMDQRDLRVRDLGRPRSSTASTRPTRSGGWCSGCSGAPTTPDLVAASDDVCTGLQLVNFLQDVPRDLALGRVYLPAEDRRRFDVTVLDAPNEPSDRAAPVRGRPRPRAARRRTRSLRDGIGGRVGRASGCSPAAGSPRSRRSRTPAGTSSRSRPRPSRLRLAREALAAVTVPSTQAYAEVERLTRARARNFAYGIMVLPKPKRRAIAAIYAFAREVDDIADGDAAVRREAGAARGAAPRASTRPPDGEAMWVALADARERFPIPAQALHDLVDGGLTDLDRQRYDTFDELREYCAHVAGAVGVACIGVYGADQPQRAEALGIALQLINIMRDVREDWELGRVYLPQDELASFGVTEDDIAAGPVTPAWQALMAFQTRPRPGLPRGGPDAARLPRPSAAPPASGRSPASTRRPWSGSRRAASTSSTARRQLSTATKLRIVAASFL